MQTDKSDLKLLLESRIPLIAVESAEENRVVDLFTDLAAEKNMPVFAWTITDGFTRIDANLGSQALQKNPKMPSLRSKRRQGPGSIYSSTFTRILMSR